MKEKLWPDLSIPESQMPVSLVTVWGLRPLLVQVTAAPAETVREAGLKKSSPRETALAGGGVGLAAGGAAGGVAGGGAGLAAGGAAGGVAAGGAGLLAGGGVAGGLLGGFGAGFGADEGATTVTVPAICSLWRLQM